MYLSCSSAHVGKPKDSMNDSETTCKSLANDNELRDSHDLKPASFGRTSPVQSVFLSAIPDSILATSWRQIFTTFGYHIRIHVLSKITATKHDLHACFAARWQCLTNRIPYFQISSMAHNDVRYICDSVFPLCWYAARWLPGSWRQYCIFSNFSWKLHIS